MLKPGLLANFIITSGDIFETGKIYENWILGEQYVVSKNLLTYEVIIHLILMNLKILLSQLKGK